MEEKKMQKFVGVRFRQTGKIYHFDPVDFVLPVGTEVIVDTDRGESFAFIATEVREVAEEMAPRTLKPVLRVATEEDRVRREENRAVERRAMDTWDERVKKHSLEMTLMDVEYAFDRSKLLFYFSAEGRVDFREFVKELAGVFKTRIELRQIGVRDEAKKVGGLGICGRPFCCASFLPDFEQVSIKMAKEQNLSLNSAKISGTCGRLMCCLRYENDVYVEESKLTPHVDWVVDTEDGRGVVTESNVLKGTIRVKLDEDPDKAPQLYRREDVTVFSTKKRPKGPKPPVAQEDAAPQVPQEAEKPPKPQKPRKEKSAPKEDAVAENLSDASEQTADKAAKKPRRRRRRGGKKKAPATEQGNS